MRRSNVLYWKRLHSRWCGRARFPNHPRPLGREGGREEGMGPVRWGWEECIQGVRLAREFSLCHVYLHPYLCVCLRPHLHPPHFLHPPHSFILLTSFILIFRAADWDLPNPQWKGRLKVVAKGDKCFIKLEDKITGTCHCHSSE